MNSSQRKARFTVAYDGSAYHGFAATPDTPTVARELTEALGKITQSEVHLVAAGRTDTGVHARGQVVSVDLPSRIKIDGLAKKLNALCGPQIAVRDVGWVDAAFHARFSAIWRHYRYTIMNSATPDPFTATTAWQVNLPLDIRPMQLACDAVMGERDFSAFCRKPSVSDRDEERQKTMKRFVMQASWRRNSDSRTTLGGENKDLVIFEIRANAFCHQMVRALVGTFVDIGLGRRPPSDMMSLIRSGRREDASQLAPPHGLCLWEVGYPAVNE